MEKIHIVVNLMRKFLIFFFLLLFFGCQKKSEIKVYVLGVDWSNSLYYFDEEKERKRIFSIVKNILLAKRINPVENFIIKTFNGVVRGLPLNTFIFIPIASDELSFREKIYKDTPEKLLWFINDENKILPPLKTYTKKTDFIDFFNISKNMVEKQIEMFSNHISFQRGLIEVCVEYILITDGIHDPKGIINLPKEVENITLSIITNSYPNFKIDRFADEIKLPENTKRLIFIGVPPRIQFDIWNEVTKKKNIKCLFFDYNELKDVVEIRKKIF